MLFFDTAHLSAGKAIKQAGVTLDRVDLFEYDDVFSIYAALQLEAVGFAVRGQGWKLAADGLTGINPKSGDFDSLRSIPCATMGGMKARGFPGGAAGVYQAAEATLQLRGQAGANQIQNAKIALIQSLGGPASTAVSHILQTT
jgi:acetyl-CoA C-acetyltransferase